MAFALAGPVAAANNTTFDASIGSCLFRGSNAGANKTVKLEWRSAEGALKLKQTVTSNSSGFFTSACRDEVETGDVLKATIGTANRSYTVAKLVLRIDRDADTVRVKAAASTEVNLEVGHANHSADSNDWTYEDFNQSTDGSGIYTANASSDITGLDWAVAWIDDNAGNETSRYLNAPELIVTVGRSDVEMTGNPGTTRSATLYQYNGGPALAEAGGYQTGFNFFAFRDSDGQNVHVAAGNYVSSDLASDASFVVPTITASINKSNAHVSANCGAAAVRAVIVWTESFNGSRYGWVGGKTNGAGAFTANFTGQTAIKATDQVHVLCETAGGDFVAKIFSA